MRQESLKPSEPVKLTYHKNLHSKRALENLEEDVRAKVQDNNLKSAIKQKAVKERLA